MAEIFSGGGIVDALLVLLAVEAVALGWWWRRTGRGVAPRAFLPFLAAGAGLLLAMRTALAGGWWGWVGLWLALAGIAHAVDLRGRWRG